MQFVSVSLHCESVLCVKRDVVGRLEELRAEIEPGEVVPRGAESVEDVLSQRLIRGPVPGHGGEKLGRVEPLRHEVLGDVDGVLLDAVVAADLGPGAGGAGVQQEVAEEAQQLVGLIKVEQAGFAVAGVGQAEDHGAQGLALARHAVLSQGEEPAAVAAHVRLVTPFGISNTATTFPGSFVSFLTSRRDRSRNAQEPFHCRRPSH